jgi:excinuclease UvrABC nuclease subunit
MNNPEAVDRSPELAFLDEWVEEIRAHQPMSKLERMQREMEAAIANEAYERAAELRDAIRAQMARKREKSAELRTRGDERSKD